MMRSTSVFVLMVAFAAPALVQDADKVAALEARVAALEQQLEALQKEVAPLLAVRKAEEIRKKHQMAARVRMRKDNEVYSKEQLGEIEKLYQVANKKWGTPEARESLKALLEKYDKANRTGCALLYMGQMSKGQERVDYLTKAIEGYSDCYYGDGVQVGAYARLYLAQHYKDAGDKAQMQKLLDEIAAEYPDAIDHRGNLLRDLIKP